MSAVQGPFFPPLFDSNKEYAIASGVAEGKVMDISSEPENYGQLVIWDCHGPHGCQNQRFHIVQHHDRYKIQSCSNKKSLTISPNTSQILTTPNDES